jgi:hypothetical protein
MDQTTNQKEIYFNRIASFCTDLISEIGEVVAKVSENFYIVVENGRKVLKQIVPENLKNSILNKAKDLGIVPTQVEEREKISPVLPHELVTEM